MDRKTEPTTRRSFLGQVAGATVVVAASGLMVGRTALASGHLPKLDPNDPTAQALAYTHQSTTDGSMCKNCQFFKGGEKAWGECAIFPGKEVNAQGWCKSWFAKAS